MSDWITELCRSFAKRLVQEEQAMRRDSDFWDIGYFGFQGEEMDVEVENVVCELIVVSEQGEEMHTTDRPFCADMRCECHKDDELWQRYIYQPWLDGILTIEAGAALFSGR